MPILKKIVYYEHLLSCTLSNFDPGRRFMQKNDRETVQNERVVTIKIVQIFIDFFLTIKND